MQHFFFYFPGQGHTEAKEETEVYVGQEIAVLKKRKRYGHYSTLLNELRTEEEKAFYNYTRLHRGLYDEVLRRVEGRIEKDTWYRKSLPPSLQLSITLRHWPAVTIIQACPTTSELFQTPSPSTLMKSAMPSKPSLLLR